MAAASVNARIPPIDEIGREKPLQASSWLDKNKAVEQMTWAPGKPMLIKNRLIADGGWIDRDGVSCFFYTGHLLPKQETQHKPDYGSITLIWFTQMTPLT